MTTDAPATEAEPLADRAPEHDVGTSAPALAGLALVGASVMLAFQQWVGDWTRGFVTSNTMYARGRNFLLVAMAVGAATGALAGLGLLRLGRDAGPARLARTARLCAPLVLIGLVPGLLAIDPWGDALMLAISVGAFVLAARPLFLLSFDAWASHPARAGLAARAAAAGERLPPALRRHGPAATVAAAALGYAVYMAFFTIRNHHKLGTYTWDLSHLDNEFWNALHGRPFRNTLMFREGNWANVRNHFQPTIYALLPFYALAQRAEALLALQAAIIGAGAIPLYRFAARHLPRALAVLIAVAYLLYPATHGAQLFDFHFQPIAAALLLAAIDCLDARRMPLCWVFLALAIGCREDVSVGTALMGLFLLLAGRRSPVPARTSAAIVGVSVAYFVTLRFFVMPALGSGGFADLYLRLLPEGERSLAGMAKTLLTNPIYVLRTLMTADKLRYALQILAPLAFLPLARPALALSLVPGCLLTLLTTDYEPTVQIFFHYAGPFVAYAFPATALALAAIGRHADGFVRRHAAAATLATGTLLATAAWGAIPPRHAMRSSYGWVSFDAPTEEQRQRLRDLEDFARMLPKTAIVAVGDREGPHVSNRYDCWSLSQGFQGADYIIYDALNGIQPDIQMGAAAERAGYIRVDARSGLVLLQRPRP